MLLGRSFRRQRNFGIEHRNPDMDYVRFKRSLLSKITRKSVGLRQWQTRKGEVKVQLLPQQTPLSRVLVQRLYRGDRKVIQRSFLDYLTLPGLALWFMDRGARRYKRCQGKIKAVELLLNTLTSKAESEAIAIYFQQTWGIQWGLAKHHQHYRLRLGTQASQEFFVLVSPYLHPNLQPLLNPADNRTATT